MNIVKAAYAGAEMVQIEFADSYLIADHPATRGGGGKGPTPGECVLAALLASTVMTLRQCATRHAMPVDSIIARGVYRSDRERIDGPEGPLPTLIFLGRMRRRIEIRGNTTPQQEALLRAAAAACAVTTALRNGVKLDESVSLVATDGPRRAVAPRNEVFIEREKRLARMLPAADAANGVASGVKIEDELAMIDLAKAAWKQSATDLGDELALVDLNRRSIVLGRVGDRRQGPSPMELLLGGLAACTAIYVGRNAATQGIPLEQVNIRVSAASLERMEKATEIRGPLTAAEFETLKYCADHCAIGETLLRGTHIEDDLTFLERGAGASSARRPALLNLAQAAPPPPESECDDGSCCIPEDSAQVPVALRS